MLVWDLYLNTALQEKKLLNASSSNYGGQKYCCDFLGSEHVRQKPTFHTESICYTTSNNNSSSNYVGEENAVNSEQVSSTSLSASSLQEKIVNVTMDLFSVIFIKLSNLEITKP